MDEIIDIVDIQGNPTGEVIGKREAHKNGILHRVVHVHFYDKNGNIYFQKRSKTKKHFPGMLHFAIGGHIGSGEDVIDALIREGKEEIGYEIDKNKISLIGKFHQKVNHPEYELFDNEIAYDYAYRFDGVVDKLIFEDGEVESIESIHIDTLIDIPFEEFEENNIVPYQFYPTINQWIKNKL